MKHPLLIILLITLALVVQAQTIEVFDVSTQSPVSEVAIYNKSKTISTITNEKGKADISVFSSTDSIYFQHPSYQDYATTPATIKINMVFLVAKVILLDEFVVAASKTKERTSNIPNRIDVIRSTEITFNNSQTSADVLENTGNIFIQRSQMGGGSPIIRGFEANKVLIVIDGVRMNNAIYRGGHLQNVITIDDAAIDRTEVVYGPGSLIYGSDALGGVMSFYTKSPELSNDTSINVFGSAYARFASANMETRGHIDFNLGFKKIASFTSFTFSDMNDSRIGSRQNPFYEDFGKRKEYVLTQNNIDKIVENDNDLKQKFTGYSQLNFLQKFLIPISPKADLTLNFQYSTSSDIPRYDKLTETTTIDVTDTTGIVVLPDSSYIIDTTYQAQQLKYAQWDYGPQKRLFASVRFDLKNDTKAYNLGSIIAAYQRINEERIDRRFGKTTQETQFEEVDVFTLNIDMVKNTEGSNLFQYGFEATVNNVNSTASAFDIVSEEISPATTRYPAGGSIMQTYAGYLKFKFNVSDKLFITPGFRYSYILLNSQFENVDILEFDLEEITLNTSAFSGSFGLAYNPGKNWQVNFLASSGYRAPNVDDMGKIFNPSDGIVVVPNENLDPEYAYNIEANISKTFLDKIRVQALVYNTSISNAILRKPFHINNHEYITFEGDSSRVYANVNVGRAVIRGFSVELEAALSNQLAFRSSITYTYGRDLTNDEPLAHIPPLFGQSSISYRKSKFVGEVVLRYHAWKRVENYSPSSVDNLNEATPEGTPAWFILNVRAGYQFNRYFRLQLAVDNILDQHYRPFGSGVSSPGVNAVVMVKVSF